MNETLINPESDISLLRRFFRWLFSRRTQRRALVGLAALATLVAVFYLEEDWRGKRAWENCKRELAAKGAVMDWDACIPLPVPDDQNFFKAPKMSEWFVKDFGRKSGDYARGYTNELSGLSTNSATVSVITNQSAARDYLAWSSQFEPQFDQIRAALKRPYAWMDGDYAVPHEIPIPNFVASRALAQVLAQRTKCYLLLGQPEQALHNITLMNDSRTWLEAAPDGKPMTLVAAMINVAITGLCVDTIAYGLEQHYWQEPQLSALQQQLAAINLGPIVASGFAFEPAAVCRSLEILKPSVIFYVSNARPKWNLRDCLFDLIPRGWIYQNMNVIARLEFQEQNAFDLTNRLVYPAEAQKVFSETEHIVAQARFSPYTFVTAIAIPNIVRAVQTFSKNQTLVNESQVVCALERYHLAHGDYPETLEALMPQFIAQLPHDLIGGQPLHYRRDENGKFLLYSVGWNERDDGGQIVFTSGSTVDREKGDWVWQYPVK